jgi:Xaa-Pro dipeptidase
MDLERHARAKAAMARERLDLLVCRLPENVLALSGYWPFIGTSYLLVPAAGLPVCILPSTEEAEASTDLTGVRVEAYPSGVLSSGDPAEHILRMLTEQGRRMKPRRIGLEADFTSLAPAMNAAESLLPGRSGEELVRRAFGDAEYVDATGMLYALRARKTPSEARRLRTVNEIAALGLAAFAKAAVPGARGIDLVAAVESAVLLQGSGHNGARAVRAFAQVAVGPEETARGFRPFEITTGRGLAKGELALLELAVVADGFWSDRTRPRAAGAATAEQQRLCAAVARAQEAAISRIRPGVLAGAVDAAARGVLEEAGLGGEFCHITGHGTGFRYHEPVPVIGPSSATALEEGMVFSIEPGVYSPAFGGLRLEDNVLVTATGAEVLGPYGKDLA